MLLSKAKKEFNAIGFKLSIKSNGLGRFGIIKNAQGEEMPSIFYGNEHREKWLLAINLKDEITPIFHDSSSDKILGL